MWKGSTGDHERWGPQKNVACRTHHGTGVSGSAQRGTSGTATVVPHGRGLDTCATGGLCTCHTTMQQQGTLHCRILLRMQMIRQHVCARQCLTYRAVPCCKGCVERDDSSTLESCPPGMLHSSKHRGAPDILVPPASAWRETSMSQHKMVRAIYHDGALQLLEPVDLSDGMELQILLPVSETGQLAIQRSRFPTRQQPPETLCQVRGLLAAGGGCPARCRSPVRCSW
jgi:predicted DNA-binding antitoxin AbrB/MazE fold protein